MKTMHMKNIHMRTIRMRTRRLVTSMATLAVTTVLSTSLFAADNLPGKGITVKPVQSTISEETFQTLLVSKALEKLAIPSINQ